MNLAVRSILIGLIITVVALLAADYAPADENNSAAINGLRSAVQVLATGLISVVSHQLGRRHDVTRCPLCEGVFPGDKAFKSHSCAVSAVEGAP